MTDPRLTAQELLLLRVLADRVAAALTAAKDATKAGMRPGERLVVEVGDVPVGTVTLAHGRVTARITDPRTLLAWVKTNHPSEVVSVEQIRSSFVPTLLKRAKDDGEVIPGIDVETGEPYLVAPVDDWATKVIAKAWAEGMLRLPAVLEPPQIEGGGPDAG